MDCANVLDLSGNPIETGCDCGRTRPIVCVEHREDGTFPDLVDAFEVCPYDNPCG